MSKNKANTDKPDIWEQWIGKKTKRVKRQKRSKIWSQWFKNTGIKA